MYNKVNLIGHLGKDPELSYTPSQKAVCKFSLATSSGKDQPTEWHNIVCWETTAENSAKYLAKGKLAGVEGKIVTRQWKDKEGKDRYTTEIVAHSVLFLGSKGDEMTRDTNPEFKIPAKGPAAKIGGIDFDEDIPF